jgi:hypothetical protein
MQGTGKGAGDPHGGQRVVAAGIPTERLLLRNDGGYCWSFTRPSERSVRRASVRAVARPTRRRDERG